jgi:hypothetical protein
MIRQLDDEEWNTFPISSRETNDDWGYSPMSIPAAPKPTVADREAAIEKALSNVSRSAREVKLEKALRDILQTVKSHVDGRDLLDELRPYHTIDIKVRCDGQERWHEGDWLSNLSRAVQEARKTVGPQTHYLKCWPEFFGEIFAGRKRHDLRRNDREFQVGDMIVLREFDPKDGYTGLALEAQITYITSVKSPCAYSEIGLLPGFCILSLTTDCEDDK